MWIISYMCARPSGQGKGFRYARQAGGATCGFSPDIVMERHAALNWLTGFDNMPDTAWDEIDTPT